jgi:alpha-N-acetylglucosaminidase
MELLEKRSRSARQLITTLRSLGIMPVLPGYYGIVPADFASIHSGAHVITQGDWNGFTRPGRLDPLDPNFDKLAQSFYRHQHDLYGDSAIYDMEIFQEGGAAGDVPVPADAKKVQQALLRIHPDALWMMMGWQQNPTQELLSSLDTSHVLIAEIEQGRVPGENRQSHRVARTARSSPPRTFTSTRDPERLLSTIPALTTAILGLLTGVWLRTSRPLRARAGISI